jgi:hypothetical protein
VKILFHANTINYRGTTVAISDYARYNQEVLGNESVIAYCKTFGVERDMGNEQAVIESLSKKFKVVGYRAGDLEKKIEKEKVDLAYFINSGQQEILPTNVKTVVHAVFQFNEPHGDKYAYISKWLSDTMSGGSIPYVPHIVNLPAPNADYRKHFGIRDDQIVVGRIGGYYTFDVTFVKHYIAQLVEKTDRFVFLFAGTSPFYAHKNIKYLNEFSDLQKKSNFINTCDVMLHARQRGESFGLSIAEFLSLNKPVMAWNNGHDLNHLGMLKDSGLLYNDNIHLDHILNNIRSFKEDWTRRVAEFKPDEAMKKFNEVFLC